MGHRLGQALVNTKYGRIGAQGSWEESVSVHGTQLSLFLTCSHGGKKDGRKELLVILCTALLSKRGRLSV